MTTNSIISLEKPMQHLGLADWYGRVNNLRNAAENCITDAFKLRHDSRTLRNETRIQSDWSTSATNDAMADRINEVGRWRVQIDQVFRRIEKEIEMLKMEKELTEYELEAMVTPLSVVGECLTMRDCRIGDEITYDDADTELKKELAILENNQKLLKEQCHNTWLKLSRLEEIKFKIGLELGNKEEAEKIDIAQLDLNKFSANITFKPNSIRHPRNSCSYEAWSQHTRNMKQMAENELSDTYAIRESLFVCREKAKNILYSQQERTEHAIRKRIFETQRARNELDWQKLKMKEEMEKALCEISNLEQALRDKSDALKLAETRLENRAQRAGMELALDPAFDQLVNEVLKLRSIRNALNNKVDDARKNFNVLSNQAQRIELDLTNKQHSLMTDIRAIDLRVRLRKVEGNSPSAQTDRNIVLTHMEDEIPKN